MHCFVSIYRTEFQTYFFLNDHNSRLPEISERSSYLKEGFFVELNRNEYYDFSWHLTVPKILVFAENIF